MADDVWVSMTDEQANQWAGAHASDYHDYKDWWDSESAIDQDGRWGMLMPKQDADIAVRLFGHEVLS